MHSIAELDDTGTSEGKTYTVAGFGRGWFLNEGGQTPRAGGLGTPRISSTRIQEPQTPQATPNADLSTLISELADQIGQSIAAQLRRDKGTNESVLTDSARVEQAHSMLNLSGVKLVMQSDVKEPPSFRGDSTDKYSVCEWVDLMNMYLVKRNIPTEQQSQEILSRLMGKAKDVVRVTLRNNLSLDHIHTPRLIFDILKQHYSELTYSSMPMADFYNTRPQQNEGVMEYWIRLNNAVDIADECLRRQGRSVEDSGHDVTMMFIKYCPDPLLSSRLSVKAAEEWTTSEIQERIDSFLRELKTRSYVGIETVPHTNMLSATPSPTCCRELRYHTHHYSSLSHSSLHWYHTQILTCWYQLEPRPLSSHQQLNNLFHLQPQQQLPMSRKHHHQPTQCQRSPLSALSQLHVQPCHKLIWKQLITDLPYQSLRP